MASFVKIADPSKFVEGRIDVSHVNAGLRCAIAIVAFTESADSQLCRLGRLRARPKCCFCILFECFHLIVLPKLDAVYNLTLVLGLHAQTNVMRRSPGYGVVNWKEVVVRCFSIWQPLNLLPLAALDAEHVVVTMDLQPATLRREVPFTSPFWEFGVVGFVQQHTGLAICEVLAFLAHPRGKDSLLCFQSCYSFVAQPVPCFLHLGVL
jgi:hypothetical protein